MMAWTVMCLPHSLDSCTGLAALVTVTVQNLPGLGNGKCFPSNEGSCALLVSARTGVPRP